MSEPAVAEPVITTPKPDPPKPALKTALVPVSETYEERFAAAVAKSGFVPGVISQAQALVKIQAGAEFGIKPVQSLNAFHIVEGKLSMAPQAQLGLLRRSGRKFRVIERSEKAAEIEFIEPDGSVMGRMRFTLQQAERAGLVKPRSAWEKYPENMLWWRAVANGIRLYYPDLTMGAFYLPDELGAAVNEDGEVIDAEYEVKEVNKASGLKEAEEVELRTEFLGEIARRKIDPEAVAARYGKPSIHDLTTDNIKHYQKTILNKL